MRPNGSYEPTPRGESGTIIAFNGHKLPIFIEPEPNDTPIHCLVNELRNYIYLTDPSTLYTILGVIAANMISGRAVWLMVVGPSACGKTTFLTTVENVPGIVMVDHLSGTAALLSGVPKKERGRDATGGLLREMGPRGCLVIEDFSSSVMRLPPDTKEQVLSAFRVAYKGRWSRRIGSDGGKEVHWSGKLALLSGATPAVDRLLAEMGELGERWLLYRYPRTDGVGEGKALMHDRRPEETDRRLKEAVAAFFGVIDLKWPCVLEGEGHCVKIHKKDHIPEEEKRDYTGEEERRLQGMANMVVRMRSGVYRNAWTKEVEDIPEMEATPRVANMLGQFYLGLERIGLNDQERWKLVSKVAMDSCPELRARVVRAAMNGGGDLDTLPGEFHVGKNAVVRAVEDLEAFGMVEREGRRVMLKNGAAQEMERYFT